MTMLIDSVTVPEKFRKHFKIFFKCPKVRMEENVLLLIENYETSYFFFSSMQFLKSFYWSIVDLQCCVSFGCTAK